MGEAVPIWLPVVPPVLEVHDAVKVRIGLPLFAPGVNATVIWAFPRVTLVIVGALGGPSANAGAADRPSTRPAAVKATTRRVPRDHAPCRTRPPPSNRQYHEYQLVPACVSKSALRRKRKKSDLPSD